MRSATNLHSNAPAQPHPSFLTDSCWQGQATLLLLMTDSQCTATNTIDMQVVAMADQSDDSIPGEPQTVQPAVPGAVHGSQHKNSNNNHLCDLHSVSPGQPHSPQLYALSRLVAIVVFVTPSPSGLKLIALLLTIVLARFINWYNQCPLQPVQPV